MTNWKPTDLVIEDNQTTEYDANDKTDLYMPGTWTSFTEHNHDSKGKDQGPVLKGASIKGEDLSLKLHICLYHDDKSGNETWGDIIMTIKNYNNIKNVYCRKEDGDYEEYVPEDYDTTTNYYQDVMNQISLWKTDTTKKTLTTSILSETVDLSDSEKYVVGEDNKGYTINAGKGSDEITGTAGNDTITGGVGNNTIYTSKGDDTVILTNGENLTLGINSFNVNNYYMSENKKDLVIDYTYSASNRKFILKDFIKKNGTGSNGSVKLLPYGPDEFDLNRETLLTFDETDLKGNQKAVSLNGTRLGDYITIDSNNIDPDDLNIKDENFDPTNLKVTINVGEGNNEIHLYNALNTNKITTGSNDDIIHLSDTGSIYINERGKTISNLTTVKAGNGQNEIYIDNSGNNMLITGNDKDTFYFAYTGGSDATTTIKAGGGINDINIGNYSFGNITIAEEKIKNTKNNITFTPTDIDYATKKGDDLILSNDDDSTLKLNSFFLTNGKYSEKTLNNGDLATFLGNRNIKLGVYGSGTVKGTDLSENIYTEDSIEDYKGKVKNDKIYTGQGDDTINAGLGKNSIYINENDTGVKTIENGGGQDTIIFAKNTSLDFDYEKTSNTDELENYIYNLKVSYKDGGSNYVLIENALVEKMGRYYLIDDATSVNAFKIGSKTYTLKSLFNRNKIENISEEGIVMGTIHDDDIYLTDTDEFQDDPITVAGNKGNDNILIGSNDLDEGAQAGNHIIDNTDNYNYNPKEYNFIDIKPTVYTSTSDGKQDKTKNINDKVVSYATYNGEYWAQSAISNIQVYGWHTDEDGNPTSGTNDTYNVYYNKQFTKIADEAGENDVLYIKDKNHNDLKLIFNLSKDYKDWSEASADIDHIDASNKADVMNLIENSFQEVKIVTNADRNKFLKNTNNNSDIGIDIDYWCNKGLDSGSKEAYIKKTNKLADLGKDTTGMNILKAFGSGVETIVAKDGWFITSDDIAQVAENVADWLNNDKTYGGIYDNVSDIDDKNAMNSLLKVFDSIQWTDPNAIQ